MYDSIHMVHLSRLVLGWQEMCPINIELGGVEGNTITMNLLVITSIMWHVFQTTVLTSNNKCYYTVRRHYGHAW